MRMLPEFFPIRYPFPQFPHAIDAIHAAMAGFTATIVGSTSTPAVTSDAVSTGVSVIWESL